MPYTSPNIEIWPGSGSFFPQTYTPFGFYDNDNEFQCDAESVASWIPLRLGFPIVDVELQQINLYAAFEEAVNEYGALINTYNARDNLITLQGSSTGSVNLSQTYIQPTLRGIFQMAKAYGSEVGAGGFLTYYTGSIQMTAGKQVYNLLSDATIETGSFATDQFTIRKIFHEGPSAINRIFDPTLGTGWSTEDLTTNFGFKGGIVGGGSYILMPLYYDALRLQQIEMNDMLRKSGYSFQLTNNRLRIFPIPTQNITLWFNYTLDQQGSSLSDGNSGIGKITDISNIPYQTLTYKYINEIGKQWIRKYALAIAKEMLGYVRTKYSAIPIPNSEVTLNGADLLSAAQSEKEGLVTELKETLDSMSQQSQIERKTAVAESLMNQLKFVPLKIYIRILLPIIYMLAH